MPEISHENFSVEFTGYLRVPVTGAYRFVTESDDGNSFYINNEEIISHRMVNENIFSYLSTSPMNLV